MKCPILMAYALTSKNYFGNLFQWRNAKVTSYLRYKLAFSWSGFQLFIGVIICS